MDIDAEATNNVKSQKWRNAPMGPKFFKNKIFVLGLTEDWRVGAGCPCWPTAPVRSVRSTASSTRRKGSPARPSSSSITWVRGPGFESGIFHNDDALQDRCV